MALVLLASLVLHLWHVNDDEAHESRAYISNTKEVQSLVGDIISIDFKKKITCQGPSTEQRYVEFTYFVQGNRDDILIVVRGYGKPNKYNVHRIQNL